MAATLIVAVAVEARQSALQTQRPPTQQPPSVVPELFGRTEQEARGLLEKARLGVGTVSRGEANAKPGTVFKQQYTAGTKLKPGTPVGFVLASRVTPPPVKTTTVPDLFGASEAKARDLLDNAGLKVGEVTRAEADARPGTVIKQSHAARAQVTLGTAVGFVLAIQAKPTPVKMVTVPDLFGVSEQKARALLEDAGLKVGQVTSDQANARPDTVIKQSHAARTQVTVGTAVGFVLAVPIRVAIPPDRGGSRGTAPPPVKMAIVPDLIGASEEQARNLLGDAGLKAGEVTRSQARARPFTVFKQDYSAGDRMPVGTAVGFVVAEPIPPDRGGRGSTAPAPVKTAIVPDLSGAVEDRARELLVNAGLQVGEVTKAEANTKPFTVFKQDYPAGAQVTVGTAVGFVLAVPITVEVPSVVGNTQGSALTMLKNGNLRSGTIKEEPSRLPKGQVLTQGIPAGTRVPAGSAVDLTIAVPITLSVPPLRRLTQPDAVALLKKQELAVGEVTTEESRELTGTVVSQRPAAGTIVEIGTRVNFVVATPITVDVPPLVNRSAEDAVALLKKLGLTVGNVSSEESRRTPDAVLSQAPAAGTRVTIGTAVAFVTARPVTALVPNVVSMQEVEARKALMANELAIGSARVEEARAAPGSVLRQSIAAGRRVTVGTAIDLVTATRVTVLVPRIAGLKKDAAVAALAAAELKPGVQYQESPAEPGTVLTQAIDPDTRVPIETMVNFVVSAVETVQVPPVVGIPKDQARQRLLAGRLSVGSETVRPVPSESRNIVLAQSAEAGSRIPIGTAVVLTVSTPEMVEVPRVVDLTNTDAFTKIASAGLKVGQVSRGLSFTRAGGTIVGQGLDPGQRVEFGTALAVNEALPRVVWAAPAVGLLAAAGLLEQRRRRKKEHLDRRPSEKAKAVPPFDVSAEANIHVGEASVRTDEAQAIRVELRISPGAGPASQDIAAVSGPIIKGERRVITDPSTNEEGTS